VKVSIDTRFADSRAADLSLAHGLRPLPALGTHRVVLPGIELELRVLGASHQVVLGDWTETVACLPDRALGLPPASAAVVGDFRVRFLAECRRLGPSEFADEVSHVVSACESDEHALVAEFPGSPLAVTALSARAMGAGARWRTWHAYPQVGELVCTSTEVMPR
jgi:hypothetical protein